MRYLALIATSTALIVVPPVSLVAQEDDSGGRLVRLLENTLSGDGRSINVEGLEGALSARATIAKITVSDDEGVWFTLEDAVLDWNRLALVRGRFSVNELSAQKIIVVRPPGTTTQPEEVAAPEAEPFALPELPVAIQIGSFSIAEIDLGEELVGTAAQLSLDGNLSLADGALDAKLDLKRLDRAGDEIVLATAFSNETSELDLNFVAKEASGGLIGSLINLPGNPPLELSINGDGPLRAFDAAVALTTDGEERFGGDITIKGLTPEEGDDGQTEQVPLEFAADLGGDLRPLMPEAYHAFFGPDTRLQVEGQRDPDGALALDRLTMNSDALSLDAAVQVSSDGEIVEAVLQTGVRPPEGDIVILPVPGAETTLERVRLNALYDADQGNDWTVQGQVKGFSTPDITLGNVTLNGDGTASLDGTDDLVSGQIDADITGLAFADEDLQSAAGDALTLDGRFTLKDAGHLLIDAMTFSGAGIAATVNAKVDGLDSGMRVEADGTVDADDIARFSGLAGQSLSGALKADFEGHFVPLSGAFSVVLDGDADDLAVGIAQVDPLITGHTDLKVDAARDENGISLNAFSLDGTAITARANGNLTSASAELEFDAEIDDVGRAVPELPGPATLSGTVNGNKGVYTGDVTLDAPQGINLAANGTYGDGQTALQLDGGLDDLGVFVPQLPGEAKLNGDVKEVDGAYVGTFTLTAPQGIHVNADATHDNGAVAMTLDAGLDNLGVFVPQLPGPATVTGKVDQEGDAFVGTVDVAAAEGVSLTADGRYAGTDISATFSGGLQDLSIFVPQLPGPATVKGDVTGTDGDFTGTVGLTASPGVTLNADGSYGPSGTEAAFTGGLEDLAIFVPQLAGAASISGKVRDEDGAYVGEVSVDTAAGARATADGTYVEGGTTAKFSATLDDLAAFVPQLPGPIRVDGTVSEEDDGGYAGQVDVSSSNGVRLAADGKYIEGGTTLTLDGGLSDLAVFVPTMPGPATLKGQIDEENSAYKATLRLSAADGSQANVDGVYGEDQRSVRFDALLQNLGAFVPPLQGTAELSGQAEDKDGTYAGSVTLGGSAGVSLNAQGSYAAEGASDVTFDLALDRVERLVAGVPGQLSAKGNASGTDGEWTFKTDAGGPAGLNATASGSYSQTTGQADIVTSGAVQLATANAFIAPMAIEGDMRFDMALKGEPGLPALSGSVSLPGARVSIPQVFGQIDPLSGQVTLANGTANVSVNGNWDDGGSFSVQGPLDLTAPFNSGITVGLNNLIVTDDSLYRTNLGGEIRVNGALAGGAQIGGVINIGTTELNIAAPTGGGGAPIPTIRHIGEGRDSYLTRERAGLIADDSEGAGGGGGGPAYGLNVTISAPKQIFVRGRGLDAELGGGMSLTGTTANVVPVGEINLIRGRLDLVGRRLELNRGLVTMQGSFDPYFEFEASNTSSAGTATLKFFGSLEDPQVEVTSSPERPPEEALGLLVFGDQFANLSPLRIAQLASSLATLTGAVGAGGGILGGARNELGVSSLDLTTDEDGNAQVGVGTYLTDNIYSDVSVNTEGRTQLDLNLDVSKNITAKGSVDNEGNSSIGIFYSRDF